MKGKAWIVVVLALLAALTASCGPKESPVAPEVVGQTPLPSEELPITSPLTVEFNQPVDAASLEGQVRIEPAVPGQWNVQGRRLVFQPSESGFQRATTYRVVIGTGVKSSSGLPLEDEVVLRFQTVGLLQVSQVQPADAATGIDRNTAITVVFNRPVVPLADLKSASGLPQPLHLEPSVDGTGEWLNTSIYVFRPEKGLAGATTYQATIAAGLQDNTGSLLPEDFTWTFTTDLPKIVRAAPEGKNTPPTAEVTIEFNQPMDAASVERAFTLRRADTGQAVSGSFTWEDETARFQPDSPLDMGAEYVAELTSAAHSATGSTLANPAQWQFGVVPFPRVIGSGPGQGHTSASVYEGVRILFASPMVLDTITPTLRVEPAGTEWQAYWNEYDRELYISVQLKPATDYRITVPAEASDPYGNQLGQDYVLAFRTGDLDPTIYFAGRQGEAAVFNAYNDTEVTVGYRNVDQVSMSLYSLSLGEFIRLNGSNWSYRNDFRPRPESLARAWTLAVNPPRNQMETQDIFISLDGRSPLPPGVYYLNISSPNIEANPYQMGLPLLVTRTHLVVKRGPEDVLVWATDMDSGDTLSAIPVAVYDGSGQALLAGTTDADGVWRGILPQDFDPWKTVLVAAGSGDALSMTSSQWSQGLNAWDFSLPSESWLTPYVGHFYTDRPIYRPGQTVYFKGIIRADDDARYSLPDMDQVRVTITDAQGQEFASRMLPVGDMGTVYDEVRLSEDAPIGLYTISAVPVGIAPDMEWRARFGTTFQVAEYRKPEYEISVTTDSDEYIQGDTIRVAVSARYYFGGAVANAPVRWSITAQPYYFRWQGQGWFDFHAWDYWTPLSEGPRVLASGETMTDEAGKAAFSVPADIQKYPLSQILSIEATVTDVSGREVSGRTAVPVHKGEFYIGLSPEGYVGTVGQEQKVSVITVTPQSDPVPNVPVSVVFSLRKWYSVQEKAADGRFYWTTRFEDTPVFTQTVTTDASGAAKAAFAPTAGGSYRVLASGRDGRGNEIQSATYLWVTGRADEYVFWRLEDNNRIDLVADKKSYAPGETARILIASPYQEPVQALLTVERGGVLSHQVVTLLSNSEQVEIPITDEHVPNIFVSAVLVKGRSADDPKASFRVGYVQLEVSAADKRLTVRVTPEREGNYGPRETARFTVETLDNSGRGVPAEVSLALVDASVLALADRPGLSLFDSFYRQRGLGIQTATNLTLALREREAEPPPDNKGGGGAEDGFAARTFFPDTAYWEPALRTDAQGKAEVSVDLPDSLTTWRMLADGATAATQVGSSTTDVVVTRDLLVRPVMPRFFVIGDRPEIAAVVHNNTDAPILAEVSLSAEGLALEGGAQTVEIAAHGLQKVTWKAEVAAADRVTATFRATGGGLQDALTLPVPVYHYTTPEVVASAGEVQAGEQRVEIVQLPDVFEPSQGDVTIRVEPSLVAGMKEGLRYLEHFPYECVEQTVSRFLPNVVTWRAYREMGLNDEALESNLANQVAVSLQKLYAAQNVDGGWGWWRTEDSNAYITAYVLFGLHQAETAGFSVDAAVLDRGIRFLRTRLNVSDVKSAGAANEQAFFLYVLAQLGVEDSGRATALYEKRDLLSQYGKAYLLMTLQRMGGGHASQVRTLTTDLFGQAVLSATGAHWEEATRDGMRMNTDVRSTAIVLQALVRTQADNPVLANAVRWLMAAREEGRWRTTQENVWAILALTDYAAATGELEGAYRFQVGLNGKRILSGDVTADNVDQSRSVTVPMGDLLRGVGNRVIVERMPLSGQDEKGALYYSSTMRYYLPVEQVQPLNRGVLVIRQYTLDGHPDEEIHEAQVGDLIRVKLTVIAPNSLHYLVVEDPIPAGTEAVDTSLRTTSQLLESPEFQQVTEEDQPWGWWVFSHTEIRDEKVALFAPVVKAGTYEYTYLLQASVPGEFLVMPAVAYEMYFPETFGRSAGDSFTVRAAE